MGTTSSPADPLGTWNVCVEHKTLTLDDTITRMAGETTIRVNAPPKLSTRLPFSSRRSVSLSSLLKKDS